MKYTKRFVLLLFSLTMLIPAMVDAQESYYLNAEKWYDAVGEKQMDNPAFEFITRDSLLPDILLIGNSISIGYTYPVREALKGVANVYRIPENGGDTKKFLDKYEDWLSTMEWDVIHINVGLHDLKRINDQGELDVKSPRRISPDQYQANLGKIFQILDSETDARIIWATTTLVPEGSAGRIPSDEKLYNGRSLSLLDEFPDIHLNDLYGFSLGISSLQREANVHYFPEGSEKLGLRVAEIIGELLLQ